MKNIGPFNEADMEFIGEGESSDNAPVTLITGENGTGKSIILDAIRGMFGTSYCTLERDIVRDRNDFFMDIECDIDIYRNKIERVNSSKFIESHNRFSINSFGLESLPQDIRDNKANCPDWVVDYWRSSISTESFKITSLTTQNYDQYLLQSLSGIQQNVKVTQLICSFDYLKGSDGAQESEQGIYLYEKIKEIVEFSLLGGWLKGVKRAYYDPIIHQNGVDVSLSNLSSGSLYIIQRMISLLGKMYSVAVLRGKSPSEICTTKGLLLIDEAENHLHPKWQKHFIPGILKIFPNLQIIATTHSPFIIASIPNARLYICESHGDHCTISEELGKYYNKPVDEILVSQIFSGTQPFNKEITDLMKDRYEAFEAGDLKRKNEIEKTLKTLNPEFFSFLDIENVLHSLKDRVV